MAPGFRDVASRLAQISRSFSAKGWALGTAGNFSAVLSHEPLRLAITPSAADKGELLGEQILEIGSDTKDDHGSPVKPSAETLLHMQIILDRGAGAVLHTHSVWSTVLSDVYAAQGGVAFEGYEMLKGLEGVKTHQHREWLPIIENSQDMEGLAKTISRILAEHPGAHGFLVRRHGLYTWGVDLAQAKRHVEILEFLLEATGRTHYIIHG